MMMSLLLSLLLQAQQPDGLEPGEHFIELATAPLTAPDALPGNGIAYGRVLDAFTGRPIAGATVELWSEEITGEFGGFHRIGQARSEVDGRVAIQRWSGSVVAEKMRVAAPGYLTLSGTAGDLTDVIRLFPGSKEPFRVRIVDSMGRPIAGARVTTSYSCSHDVPAFDLRTDARGVAECREFGLQDEIQQLRVRARGFSAIEYLDADDALAALDPEQPFTVFLPRRRAVTVRLLDQEGDALAGEPIYVIDGECYHVERTDKTGLLRIESRYDNDYLSLRVLRPQQNLYIGAFTPPRNRVVTMRLRADDWPEQIPVGSIRIEMGERDPDGSDGEGPRMQLHHEDGWSEDLGDDADQRIEFPAGKGFLMVGGDFSGYAEEIHDFEVTAGEETVLRPVFKREPRVTIAAPETLSGGLWIEAGDATREQVQPGEPIPVPGDRPLCVFHDGDPKLRLLVKGARDGMMLDLRTTKPVVPPAQPPVGTVAQEFRFSTSDGKELIGVLSLSNTHPLCTLEPADSAKASRHVLKGPPGARWLASFEASGHQEIWLRGRLAPHGARIERVVPRSASVRIEAPFEFEILGYDDHDLVGLAPGPLHLVLERKDGRRHGLHLKLKPGAKRLIKLH